MGQRAATLPRRWRQLIRIGSAERSARSKHSSHSAIGIHWAAVPPYLPCEVLHNPTRKEHALVLSMCLARQRSRDKILRNSLLPHDRILIS